MRYKSIKYARTSNLGQGENERVEIMIDLHPDDNVDKAFADLKATVKGYLGIAHEERPTNRPFERLAGHARPAPLPVSGQGT